MLHAKETLTAFSLPIVSHLTRVFRFPTASSVPIESLAFILSLHSDSLCISFRGLLLERFASPGKDLWHLEPRPRACRRRVRVGAVPAEVVVLQLPMRFFVRHDGKIPPVTTYDCELPLDRARVKLDWDRHHGYLVEQVVAITLTLYLSRDAPYTIVALTDTDDPYSTLGADHPMSANEYFWADRQTWELNGIVPCGRCTGVAQFLATSALGIALWEQGWRNSLSAIDSVVNVDVGAFHLGFSPQPT